MFCARTGATLGLLLTLAVTSAQARELEFSVENRIGASDNVFFRENDSLQQRQADGFWEILPGVVVRDEQDELQYNFRYRPSYERYFTESGINGVDHTARGSVNWQITPRHGVGATGNFGSARRLREDAVGAVGFDPDAAFEATDRQRVKRARGALFYSAGLSRRLSGRLDYSFDDLDFSQRDINDSRAHTGSAGLNFAFDGKTTFGGRLTGRWRNSKLTRLNPNPLIPFPLQEVRSASQTVDFSLSVTRQLTETLNVSVSAGPSWVRTEQDVQTGAVAGRSKTNDLSFFASASAQQRWRNVDLTLNYSRFESGGGSVISSSIVDDVTLRLVARPAADWRVVLLGGWNRREEIAENLLAGGDTEFTRWRFSGSVSHRVSQNLVVIGSLRYRDQDRSSSAGTFLDARTEVLTGFVSLQYTFDPIVF